jgi:hypothetical protein
MRKEKNVIDQCVCVCSKNKRKLEEINKNEEESSSLDNMNNDGHRFESILFVSYSV